MDRFDEMRAKGGRGADTSDATATEFDILEGKTAYVASGKVTGVLIPTTGADLSGIGTEVTAMATNTIIKGGKFMGVKNENYTPTWITAVRENMPTLLSDDMEVGINKSQSVSTSTTSVNIYFYNSETGAYDTVEVPLPTFSSNKTLNGARINGAGDLALILFEGANTANSTAYIVVEIDKKNRKGTAYSFLIPYAVPSSSASSQFIFGNLLNFASSYIYRYDKETHQPYKLTKKGSFSFSSSIRFDAVNTTFVMDENTIVIADSGYISKYIIDKIANTIERTYIQLSSGTYGTHISRDGKRACYHAKSQYSSDNVLTIYNVDLENMAKSTYATHTGYGYGYVDGDKMLRNGVIYNISNPNEITEITTVSTTEPSRARAFNIKRFYAGALYILPDGDAEYLIESAVSPTIVPDKIYGIAAQTMRLNDVGKVQLLFNSYTSS